MLGELLELAHTSADRWSTLRATVQRWTDRDVLRAATDAKVDSLLGRGARPPGTPWGRDRTGERRDRLTVVATSRPAIRLESPGDEDLRLVVIRPDGGILTVAADGTAQSEPDHRFGIGWRHLGAIGPMLAPDQVVAAFRLRPTGIGSVAGRECLLAEGRTRSEIVRFGPDLLGYGVERATMAVDRGTGLLLRLEAIHADRPALRLEVAALELDGPVAEDLFSLEPPPGSGTRDLDERGPRPLSEVAARVPFTLLAPPPAHDRHPWVAHLQAGGTGSATVTLMRIGVTPRERPMTMIVQAVDPERLPDVSQWQELPDEELSGHVWVGERSTHLMFWRDGTGVWIRDAEDVAAARRLARSLRPVA